MGGVICDNIKVLGNSSALAGLDYDEIIIASLTGFRAIKADLIKAGVPEYKINSSYVLTQVEARINFLKRYAEMSTLANNETAAVAEGGVFQGEFAKEINLCFPNNDLYLFDTFEGFDQRDVQLDESRGFSEETKNNLSITSTDLVLSKLPYKERAIFRKGYFPETTQGLESLRFIFVNLDFDLYKPILAGLEYFYPRLLDGAVMLIHDYYSTGYFGVKQAVEDYEQQTGVNLVKLPIGDDCSLAIVKV